MSQELLDVSERVRAALLSNDPGALLDLVAEDYCGFDPQGGKHDRETMLQAYAPGGVKLDTYETRDVTTRTIGDAGLVMGLGRLSGNFGDHEFKHNVRFLDVYERCSGSWRLLVSQVTELEEA